MNKGQQIAGIITFNSEVPVEKLRNVLVKIKQDTDIKDIKIEDSGNKNCKEYKIVLNHQLDAETTKDDFADEVIALIRRELGSWEKRADVPKNVRAYSFTDRAD